MTLEEAKSRMRTAGGWGLVAGGMTLTVMLAAMSSKSERLSYFADPWLLLDVLLIAALSAGTLRRSRFAACGLFVYYFLAKIAVAATTGSAAGLVVGLLFLIVFGRGAHATFVYHRLTATAADDAQPNPLKIALAVLGMGLGALLLAVMVLGMLMQLRILPDTTVVAGEELRGSTVEMLREHGALEPGETIQYFYTGGFLRYQEDGNLFTDRAVVSYLDLGGDEEFLERAPFEEIEDIEIHYSESWLDDTLVQIYTSDGEDFLLVVSIEEDLDHVFCDALMKRWQASQPAA